jgi:general secretion pathway protein D
VDPRVRGPVNVDSLAVNALTYHAFLEVLGVHGFVAVPSGDVVTIIPEASAARVASPIVNVDDIKGDDAEVVTALIPAGENSMELNPILRQIVPQWGLVQVMPDRKSLLVVDRVANIKRIAALVRAQEKPQ